MKTLYLLPYTFKRIGYWMVIPFFVLGIAYLEWDFTFSWLNYHTSKTGFLADINANFTDELAAIGLICSLFLIAFSKERVEDEAISFFRLEALHWAVYANYAVLLLAIIFCYGSLFFTVMTVNLFTVLFIFIARFRYVLYQYNKSNP